MDKMHRSTEGQLGERASEDENQKSQWTIKGLDAVAVELSRKAAQKRGMRIGAWVSEALMMAASGDLDQSSSRRSENEEEVWGHLKALEKKILEDLEKIHDSNLETGKDVRLIHRKLLESL
ncbi:MAG TPA: hypothetical protein VGN05_00495 [Parvibaculum sp.]|jgi:hypothetical protein